MNEFTTLTQDELQEVDGGGFISMVAGAIAGGIIGAYVSFPVAVVKRDPSICARGAILGASIGAYVGAGCPLP